MAPPLEGTNVALLDGRREVVYRGGAPIELIGLPGVDRRDLSPALVDAMPPREPGMLRVVLSHYPDHLRRTEALQPDLFLTGHTHGGQICLPGGAAIIRHDKLPRPMYAGLHHVDRTWLVVNRGLGFSGPAVRLFCPAEVIELRLTRGGA
jgi:predicted MPP superfamily phosphohydrolase